MHTNRTKKSGVDICNEFQTQHAGRLGYRPRLLRLGCAQERPDQRGGLAAVVAGSGPTRGVGVVVGIVDGGRSAPPKEMANHLGSLELDGEVTLADGRIVLRADGNASLGILEGLLADVRSRGTMRLAADPIARTIPATSLSRSAPNTRGTPPGAISRT